MQFTPQQITGAQRYSSKTRVGNWFEELCLEDAKNAETNNSDFIKFKEKINRCTKTVSFFKI